MKKTKQSGMVGNQFKRGTEEVGFLSLANLVGAK